MSSPLLVTGGTGRLGRRVVPDLQAAGRAVRVLSRQTHAVDGIEYVVGDLASGQGVHAAVRGVEAVVHLAGTDRGDEEKARTLVRAAQRAGVRHLINISVVGADRVPVVSRVDRAMFGYFASQREAEEVIAQSNVGWTNLRATQFHDLTFTMVRRFATLRVALVPRGLLFQPVDVGLVADRVVELALGEPAGQVPDIAGPRVYRMEALVRSYLHAGGRRAAILPLPVPGMAARACRAGATLAPEAAAGGRTWEDYLRERLGGDAGTVRSSRPSARPDPASRS